MRPEVGDFIAHPVKRMAPRGSGAIGIPSTEQQVRPLDKYRGSRK
jgi:hypothetical protein